MSHMRARQNHGYVTTDELFRFHNDEFDEMPCKLDSTENDELETSHVTHE